MKKLAILGSTGSIGRSALSLVDLHPDRFEVETLAAGSRIDELYEQTLRYRPSLVAVHDPECARALHGRLDGTRVVSGIEGVVAAACAPAVETVVAGISGAIGLLPTFQALLHGKRVALANKETLVMAGDLIMKVVSENQGCLLPVDSEHGALHQCLRGVSLKKVKRILLTASGGPFLEKSEAEMRGATVEEALRHPTWSMGPKITIDSATLMNKGLEVIEAHHLFGMPADQISVVIHPQSMVHSLVEFVDGNFLAQMGVADMRSPILYALSYPDQWDSKLPALDLFSIPPLRFFPPDTARFPCLRLAYQALKGGLTYPAVLNAANEVAVEAFLGRRIPFFAIPEIIEQVLQRHDGTPVVDLETVMEADREGRELACGEVARRA